VTTPNRETLLEEGEVLAVHSASHDAPARVSVRLIAGDHCEGCAAKSMCKSEQGDRRIMEAIDPLGVAVGDRVQVSVPGEAVLKASFLVYGLPLLLLLAGVWLGSLIWAPENEYRDLWSFLLGAGLAAAALPMVRVMVNQRDSSGRQVLEPRIASRLTEALVDPTP